MPLFGTVLAPQFLVKSAKGKDLFVSKFYGRFNGAARPSVPPAP